MIVKLRLVFSITILFSSFYGFSQAKYWQKETSVDNSSRKFMQQINVKEGKVFSLDEKMLCNELEILSSQKETSKIVYFPDEKGIEKAFRVFEKSVFSPELAKKYPEIKSYYGYALDKKGDKIVFSVSPNGIQSMVVHANSENNTFIQKVSKKDDKYLLYHRDYRTGKEEDFICNTKTSIAKSSAGLTQKLVDDQVLRKFRLAVSASGEYTEFHGGTVADALAAINATLTRINEVFETDLGIRLELIASTDMVIYTDETTDPYTGSLSTQVQNTLTSVIGEENYDIGHLFHEAPANGNSGFIGAVCVDNRKGSGFAASRVPEGDTFDLDFVAHEMGHQFGANHTWSFEPEGTLAQMEPGSGTTIMGYAGIAQNNNVTLNGDDYFHYQSILQISEFLETASCATIIPLVNTPPVITTTGNYIIPKSTAFVLTATATDIDVADVLTYAWEQIDDGVVTNQTFGPTNTNGANFRSQKPSTNPERYFPKLASVIAGNLTQTNPGLNAAWETVSDVEREMNFGLTVRDNSIEGGQVKSDIVNVNVVGGSGPFLVTSQTSNETYLAGTIEEITWDIANTNKAPVNANTVDILISTDGGVSFPITLAEDVPNDGSHEVLIPGIATTTSRIMVKAHDNIFFAVNASDFNIEASEIVLNFTNIEYEVCTPDDIVATFNYETYLGFNEEVTFSISDAPAGLNVAFSTNTAQANNTPVSVTFSNTNTVAKGTYPVTVLATSATITKEIVLQLEINDAIFSPVVLAAPTDGFLDAGISEPLIWDAEPAYSSYDIEIATDIGFTTIVETATVIFNTYKPLNLVSETTYYWRIKPKNLCGEGIFGAPFSFTTLAINCTDRSAVNLPIEISDIGAPTITSKIIFNEDLPVADINVNLNITHSYLADLIISLTSPSGTVVVLTSSSCGDFRNIDATFDHEASSFVCGSSSPSINGIVKPLGSLASFNGESLQGEWILKIEDLASNDGGALNDFSMDICVEGVLRPDEDEDGVFDDGDDLCLGTPKGVEVDTGGCAVYRLPTDNFTVAISSESCRDNNDGSIGITSILSMQYNVTVNSFATNITDVFTDSYLAENLNAGTYTVCITGTDGAITYEEFCFDVVITEPDVLDVSSEIIGDNEVKLTLEGSLIYTIELNGLITQTEASEIILSLKNKTNILKVTADLSCQGIHEEQFFISDEPIIYPNPVITVAKVFLGKVINDVDVTIHSVSGQFISRKKYTPNSSEIEIDFSALPTGIYFIAFEGAEIKGNYKVIKE